MPTTLTGHRVSRARRGSVVSFLGRAFATWRQRQSLKDLDAHLLRDIGISAGDACAEAQRPIWDVPVHWTIK